MPNALYNSRPNALEISAITGKPMPTDADRFRMSNALMGIPGMVYGNYIQPGVNAMNRLGAGMTGQGNPYQVDEINDPRTVNAAMVKDVMDALSLYSGPGILSGKPSATSMATFGGRGAKNAPKEAGAWFKGMEGKPRFEIDDSSIKLNKDIFTTSDGNEWLALQAGQRDIYSEKLKSDWFMVGKKPKFSDAIIGGDELLSQYPKLANIPVDIKIGPNFSQSGTAYTNSNGTISKITVSGKTPDEVMDTLIHEVQHWIQGKEGFARGGDLEKGTVSIVEMMRDPNNKSRIEEILSKYENIAGEIEARDAANRRTWPMDLRKTMPPDVRKDAIIRMER